MENVLKQLENLVGIASAIIETPTLALKDFGVIKDPKTHILTYTKDISPAAAMKYATVASVSSSFAGAAMIVGRSFLLSGMAGGVPSILIGLYLFYNKRKRKQQEKDRIYKEIIKKQQAAIAKQVEINRELEQRLKNSQQIDEQSRKEIDELRMKLTNLSELLGVLTEQQENFKAA